MKPSIAIVGELTVFTAHDNKARLLEAMSPQGDLTVELTDVCEFDGAGLQLLLSTHRESARRGGALRLAHPSAPVRAALQLTGLTDHFDVFTGEDREVTP